MKTLIVGYGNPSRSDDGAGIQAAQRIEEAGIPGVDVRIYQQLPIELTEDLGNFERVVFVDASHEGVGYSLSRIGWGEMNGVSSSHFQDPGMMLELCRRFYGKAPEAWLCRIRGEVFEFGSEISWRTQIHLQEAVKEIIQWIRQEVIDA